MKEESIDIGSWDNLSINNGEEKTPWGWVEWSEGGFCEYKALRYDIYMKGGVLIGRLEEFDQIRHERGLTVDKWRKRLDLCDVTMSDDELREAVAKQGHQRKIIEEVRVAYDSEERERRKEERLYYNG